MISKYLHCKNGRFVFKHLMKHFPVTLNKHVQNETRHMFTFETHTVFVGTLVFRLETLAFQLETCSHVSDETCDAFQSETLLCYTF